MASHSFSRSLVETLLLLALWGGAAPTFCSLAQAQQQDPPPVARKEAAKPLSDSAAFVATRRAANILGRTNPEAAANLYGQLLQERPGLLHSLIERSYSEAARLRARGGNVSGALELLDEGSKRVAGNVGSELRLIRTRASLLLGAKRAGEAEAVLEAHRQKLLRAYPSSAASLPTRTETAELLLAHLDTLEAQRKWGEMAEAASEALWRLPGLLEDRSVTAKGNKGKGKTKPKSEPGLSAEFYDRLLLALQKAKQPEEALRWAKLRFEVCAFEKGPIDRAVASLRGVWISNGELEKPGQFNTYLREGGPENPLRAIQAPTLEAREIEAYLVALVAPDLPAEVLAGGPDAKSAATTKVFGSSWGRQTQRVSLLLLLRRHDEAAAVAQGILQGEPSASAGADQIARVLKAREGNLSAGNRFYEFLKTGKGDNPLQKTLAK